jgi:small-conductance mechanosensitive channel
MLQNINYAFLAKISEYSVFQIETFRFIVIIVGALILAKLFFIFFKKYLHQIASKTETELDDLILQIVTKPFYFLIILAGLHLAILSLESLEKYFSLVDRIFFILYALIITWVISKLVNLFIGNWLKVEEKYEKTPQLVTKVINIVIYIIVLLIILDHFGVSITPLVASLGVGGLAIGLALQSTLANFFAGLHIISDRPIQVGDYIELDNGQIAGFVEDIGWRSIRLRTLANNLIVIPNNTLANSIIKNRSAPTEEQSAVIEGGVAYDSNLKKVEKILLEIGKETIEQNPEMAIQDFEPIVRFYQFGESNINFKLIVRANSLAGRSFLIHDLVKRIKERFDKENIEISWPVRKVYFGNKTKLNHFDKDT